MVSQTWVRTFRHGTKPRSFPHPMTLNLDKLSRSQRKKNSRMSSSLSLLRLIPSRTRNRMIYRLIRSRKIGFRSGFKLQAPSTELPSQKKPDQKSQLQARLKPIEMFPQNSSTHPQVQMNIMIQTCAIDVFHSAQLGTKKLHLNRI